MDINLLDPELREMLGNLRGQDPPEVHVLQRLLSINRNFRITWTPATLDRVVGNTTYPGRPGLYHLHEVRPNNPHDRLRAAAGHARLERYHKFGDDRKQKNLGIPAQCEDMMAGYWPCGSWPKYTHRDEDSGIETCPFGSDRFFFEVQEGEAMFHEEAKRLTKEAALDQTADEEILSEFKSNDAYRQAALEDWALIFADRKSVDYGQNQKGTADVGTDRKQVEGPGQGLERGRIIETSGGVGGARESGQQAERTHGEPSPV